MIARNGLSASSFLDAWVYAWSTRHKSIVLIADSTNFL